MTCTELQRALPHIVDWEPTAQEHAHLDSCRGCRNLVVDRIVQSAKFLVSLEKLPSRVWHKIRSRLERQEPEDATRRAASGDRRTIFDSQHD